MTPVGTQVDQAVVFDLDGVLIDSEPVWEEVRREFVALRHGRWPEDAQERMMGMSTGEWSSYLSHDLGVGLPPDEVAASVISRLRRRYERHLPLLDGAMDAVRRLQPHWPLGLASSSPRELIEIVLDRSRLRPVFKVTLSTEEIGRGKPAPDIYLEATRLLGANPRRSVAIEDSTNGIRAAVAAGLRVVAIPRPQYPPDPMVLAQVSQVLDSLHELTVETVQAAAGLR